MAVSRHTYATREQLKSAAGWDGATMDADADRLIVSHTSKVEDLYHRRFFPRGETRTYDWPSAMQVSSKMLWLDEDLISLTTLTASGDAVASGDVFLRRPWDDLTQPVDRIELDETSDATFGAGGQQSIEVEGVWGYSNDEVSVGTLVAAIDADDTTFSIEPALLVGVGDLIRLGTERMIVADRQTQILTVIRGAYGTTAASHLISAPIVRHVPKGLITDLVIAECIAQHQQETGGYGVSVGQGGQSTPEPRIALLDLRARARDAYKRDRRVAL